MCFVLLLFLVIGSAVHSSTGERNLAKGRPSLQSSVVIEGECDVTDGSLPPLTRDWYLIQLSSTSLVGKVQLAGIQFAVDVLVGDDFSPSPDLDFFLLCTTYDVSQRGSNVTCITPLIGSTVALRARNNDDSIRLCSLEVFGWNDNLLLTAAASGWAPHSWLSIPVYQQSVLLDGNLTTCINAFSTSSTQPLVIIELKIPDFLSDSLWIRILHEGIPYEAVLLNSYGPEAFHVLVFTGYDSPGSVKGLKCSLLGFSRNGSAIDFRCACLASCKGTMAIQMFSSKFNASWRICDVTVLAPTDVDPRLVLARMRHCGEWLSAGWASSGHYVIDPDGMEGPVTPFTVYCNMTDGHGGLRASTVVDHSLPARASVAGPASALAITFPVAYSASGAQLEALIAVSQHCQQWLLYECLAAPLYKDDQQQAGWWSRQGHLQPGWAGVPAGSSGCACSLRGQCGQGQRQGQPLRCHCDLDDDVWRKDAGWITAKSLLPVSQLAVGGARQRGHVTLGSLVCFG